MNETIRAKQSRANTHTKGRIKITCCNNKHPYLYKIKSSQIGRKEAKLITKEIPANQLTYYYYPSLNKKKKIQNDKNHFSAVLDVKFSIV